MRTILFGWFDCVLFCLTIGLSAAIGIYYGFFKKQNTTTDYLHGGKTMKVFPVAMSSAAGMVSGIALLGVPTETYLFGGQYFITVISVIIAGFVVNYLFLPVLYKLQITSIYEYLELRFNRNLRRMTSMIGTINIIIALPIIIYAPSLALNQVTGFNLYLIATLVCLFCVFYTSLGGVKSVIFIDTLQFLVTLSTFACVLVLGTISVGGVSQIWTKADMGDRLEFFNMDPDPTARSTFWNVLIGNFFIWTYTMAVNQGTVQRLLSVPTYRDSQKVLGSLVFFMILTKLVGCMSGLIVYAKYYDCDPLTAGLIEKADQIIPFYVMDVSSSLPGLGGLFTAGMCTTALSTLSTALNSGSGVIYQDFVSPCMPPETSERRASTIMKLITVLIGLIITSTIFIVAKLGTVFQLALSIVGVTGGPTMGLFAMGMFLPTVNSGGALTGFLTSITFMVIMVVGNQFYIWNGVITSVPKPLYTYGCNNTLESITAINNATSEVNIASFRKEEAFWLFNVSFYYYMALGTIICMVVGLIASRCFKNKDDPPINPDLISPCFHRFLPKSAFETKCVPEIENMLMQSPS